MVELTQETKKELIRAFCAARICGLRVMGEAYNNQIRGFQHLEHSKYGEYVASLNSAFKELILAEDTTTEDYDWWDNTNIYDINTKYNLGIDFEEEDRKLNEFLNNSNFAE